MFSSYVCRFLGDQTRANFHNYYPPYLTEGHKGRRSTFCTNVTPTVFGQTLQVEWQREIFLKIIARLIAG